MGLNVSPTKVISVVDEAVQQTDIANVAKDPSPHCVLMDMDNKGYARYAMRYWLTDLMPDDPTDAAVRWHIMTALQRVGIKLAMEERSIHLTKENEKHEDMVRNREVLLRMKTLRRVELFSQMNDDELRKLAERLKYAPFAKGNIISKRGAIAHWLYIIINGEAEVYVEAANGEKHVLNVLSKGSFFGEMGMMTGAPRSASVIAKTDVECYRLDKEAFEEILLARPGIAEGVSHVLVARRAQLDSALQNMDEETRHQEIHHQHNEVLATIKRFFGL